jgi:hypothetical protein
MKEDVKIARSVRDHNVHVTGYPTEMKLYEGQDSPVAADQPETMLRSHHWATLRRVGWLDQKGRVWTETPCAIDFDGGSLTPLLIDAREGVLERRIRNALVPD